MSELQSLLREASALVGASDVGKIVINKNTLSLCCTPILTSTNRKWCLRSSTVRLTGMKTVRRRKQLAVAKPVVVDIARAIR